jgi:hypothetical protein
VATQQSTAPFSEHLRAGTQALTQGKFQLAVQELTVALALRDQNPAAVPLEERRHLIQAYGQASLLAELLAEPLADIVETAADTSEVDDQEWQKIFHNRYYRKAVVFDAEVRRVAPRRYELDYAVFVRGRPARLNFDGVHLFNALPLEKPQRLLVGVRLGNIRLEKGGVWTIHFLADSGILLTDAGAVRACCEQPGTDVEELLARQTRWVAQFR